MSLTVPITTAQMSSGVTGYSGTPEQMTTGVAQPPSVSASVSAGSNAVAFGAAGWVGAGAVVIYLLYKWGFRFAHVPV